MSARHAESVDTVTFGDLPFVCAELYSAGKTLFVFDLDDTLFSARGDDDTDPEDYAGLDGPGAPDTVAFDDLKDGVTGFFVRATGTFLRGIDAKDWTVLTTGELTHKDMDGNRVALMLGVQTWAPPRMMTGFKAARVRSEQKLAQVEKLANQFPGRELIFFDDKASAFARASEMPRNVLMLRVLAREDEDDE